MSKKVIIKKTPKSGGYVEYLLEVTHEFSALIDSQCQFNTDEYAKRILIDRYNKEILEPKGIDKLRKYENGIIVRIKDWSLRGYIKAIFDFIYTLNRPIYLQEKDVKIIDINLEK